MSSIHDSLNGSPHGGGVIPAHRPTPARTSSHNDGPEDLFPDIPEAKKRKFILVEDSDRQSRLRVRVTLDGVDTREIPDSFRKSSSVYPRSYFPREMQSPPPSATGSKFFTDDANNATEDDRTTDTEGRRSGRGGRGGGTMVKVPTNGGQESEVAIPRTRKAFRGKEVRLNDLGYRMAWLQSRVFAGRTVFLQRACKSSRFLPCFGDAPACQRLLTHIARSGLLQEQDAKRFGVDHAGCQAGGTALRDARWEAQVEREDARRGEGGVVLMKGRISVMTKMAMAHGGGGYGTIHDFWREERGI